MAETTPENVDKPGVPCPKCGAVHDSYPSYDGRVKCPSCHLFLKRDSIPEEFLEKREAKKRREPVRRPGRKAGDEPVTGARQEAGDDGRETRREQRRSPDDIWREEKEPFEIVAAVLERHGAKSTFIDYVTERIQDMGEMRTDMLTNMLQDMDPGVKKQQIPYIIEDVVAALRRAEEEAWQRREPGYAMGRDRDRGRGRDYGRGRGRSGSGAYPSRRGSRDSGDWWPSSGYRESFGGEPASLSKEDVVDVVDRMMEKRGREDRLSELEKARIQDKADTEKMISEKFAELNETLAARKEEKPEPEGLTRDELVEIMKSEKTDSYLKYMEQKSKDDKALHERTLNTLIEERKETREDKKELEEKLAAASVPTSSGEYSRDETRLLADGLKIVGAKEPIKNAGKIIIEFIKPGSSRGGSPPRREKVGEEGITDLLPDDFVREE